MLCCAKLAGVACRPEQAVRDETRQVTLAYVALRIREGETQAMGIEKSRKIAVNSGERLILPAESASFLCCE
jgi:hypothetical protein